MNIFFVFNLKAGKGMVKRNLPDIIDIICRAGHNLTVHATQFQGDAMVAVKNIPEKHYDRVLCAGGDGTLDEVVAGMLDREEKLPIGYIPAGSTNDFAVSLGLPKQMKSAAGVAIGNTHFRCDVGCFNEKSFVYIAAFGLFTEVSYETPQDVKNVLGHTAYLLEGIKSLQSVKSYKMKVTWDEGVIEDEFIYGMITNSDSVGGFKNLTGKEVDLSDGLFEVTLVSKPANPIEFNEILYAFLNRDYSSKGLKSFKTSRIKFESIVPVSWTLDGEYGGTVMNAVIENKHEALDIIVKE